MSKAMEEYRLLIVGEDAAARNKYAKALIDAPLHTSVSYQVMTVSSAAAAQLQVTRQHVHVMLVILAQHNEVLLDLVRRMKELYPDMHMLLLHDQQQSGQGQIERLKKFGVQAMLTPVEEVHLQAMIARLLGISRPTRWEQPPQSTPHLEDAFSSADMQELLNNLRRQARAQLAIYTDNLGNIIARHGDEGDIDVPALSSLIAGSFVNSMELGRTLRDPDTVHLSVHEGRYFDVYSANVGCDRLLALFFDKQFADPKLGFIWLMMKRVAVQLRDMAMNQQNDTLHDQFGTNLGNEFDRLFGDELTRPDLKLA